MLTADDEQELREKAEIGRRHKIAKEVFSEFLDKARKRLIEKLETNALENNDVLRMCVLELSMLRQYSDYMKYIIQQGEMAEERLANGE